MKLKLIYNKFSKRNIKWEILFKVSQTQLVSQ